MRQSRAGKEEIKYGCEMDRRTAEVIQLRNRNILVSAAAGSGKTAVLVERIITMLTEDDPPVDVDKLLIVTFTEAAASEMKKEYVWRLRRNYWNTRKMSI